MKFKTSQIIKEYKEIHNKILILKAEIEVLDKQGVEVLDKLPSFTTTLEDWEHMFDDTELKTKNKKQTIKQNKSNKKKKWK